MMTRQERAKIFAPFDAMKGLQEALRDREERHLRVERHDISEEQEEHNSEVLAKLTRGMHVRLDYYSAFHDVSNEGIVTDINTVYRFLKLGTEKISFCDIYDINITEWS